MNKQYPAIIYIITMIVAYLGVIGCEIFNLSVQKQIVFATSGILFSIFLATEMIEEKISQIGK